MERDDVNTYRSEDSPQSPQYSDTYTTTNTYSHEDYLPEVVNVDYPEPYAYVRQRNEPGDTPLYLAFDQTGKEAVDGEVISPSTPYDFHAPAKGVIDEPPEEGLPAEEKPHTIFGFAAKTFWVVLILSVVVIAAAIGGGVGGGIAATQHNSSDAQLVTSSSTSLGYAIFML
jgi:hypothetical protein